VYQLLRLRGTVRQDSETGAKLGRRHRFSVAWDGALSVPNTGQEYKKTRVRYFTPEMDEWEAKYLQAAVG
jgi:hypothetical protein